MITSRSNKKIKDTLSIKKNHSALACTMFFIEGRKVVESAFDCDIKLLTLFYTDESEPLLLKARDKNIEALLISENLMKVICDTVTPQGIAAIASMKPSSLSDIDSLDAKLLICDRIKDPGNMGNIIRASDVFGVKAVIILNGSCNPFAPKVVRATSGSIFNIPIIFADIDELLKWTKAQNIPLIATHPKKGIPIYSAIFGNKFGLIIGEEGQGVDDHLLLLASQIVTIPITGQAESLNVANAAGICLYEVLRQEAMGQTII